MLRAPVYLVCKALAKPWQDAAEDNSGLFSLGQGHYTILQLSGAKGWAFLY